MINICIYNHISNIKKGIVLTSVITFPFLFSPRFNYRSTHHLASHGFYEFLNWFDERAWYPLGRIVGGTVSMLAILYVTVNC